MCLPCDSLIHKGSHSLFHLPLWSHGRLLKPGFESKVVSCQSLPLTPGATTPPSHQCRAALAQAPVSHSAQMTNCPYNGLLASACFPSSGKWAVFNVGLLSHLSCATFLCDIQMRLSRTASLVSGWDSAFPDVTGPPVHNDLAKWMLCSCRSLVGNPVKLTVLPGPIQAFGSPHRISGKPSSLVS